MLRGLLSVMALMAILLPLSDGVKRCNSSQPLPGACSLKPERGRCRAYLQRYYYNSNTGRCQTFVYGGCGGNANNFKTKSQCKKKCIRGHTTHSDVCSMRLKVGHCKARIPRYYYNSRSKQCQRFYYGGCGGNDNNFRTLSQCQKKCNAGSSCPVAGQIYSSCARPCRNTCDQLRKRLWCKAVCKPGCDCPKGQVVDKRINKCVPTRQCSRSKPGLCPRRWALVKLQLRYVWPPRYPHCQHDYQCGGRKKCCRRRHGRKSCVTPVYRRWRRG